MYYSFYIENKIPFRIIFLLFSCLQMIAEKKTKEKHIKYCRILLISVVHDF